MKKIQKIIIFIIVAMFFVQPIFGEKLNNINLVPLKLVEKKPEPIKRLQDLNHSYEIRNKEIPNLEDGIFFQVLTAGSDFNLKSEVKEAELELDTIKLEITPKLNKLSIMRINLDNVKPLFIRLSDEDDIKNNVLTMNELMELIDISNGKMMIALDPKYSGKTLNLAFVFDRNKAHVVNGENTYKLNFEIWYDADLNKAKEEKSLDLHNYQLSLVHPKTGVNVYVGTIQNPKTQKENKVTVAETEKKSNENEKKSSDNKEISTKADNTILYIGGGVSVIVISALFAGVYFKKTRKQSDDSRNSEDNNNNVSE